MEKLKGNCKGENSFIEEFPKSMGKVILDDTKKCHSQ